MTYPVLYRHEDFSFYNYHESSSQHCSLWHDYRLLTKLQKGNVFSHVYMSVQGDPSTGPWPFLVQGLTPSLYVVLAPGSASSKLIHYEVQTVGRRVVGIRLKSLLVHLYFYTTGRERLIRSHSSARFRFELSVNSN